MSSISSRFITIEELEAQRKARIAEGKPEEEEPRDPRSLFEQLQSQKDEKQRLWDEEHAFKNQVRGLNEEETLFLAECSDKAVKQEREAEEELETLVGKIEKPPQETLTLPPVSIKPAVLKPKRTKQSLTAQRASLLGAIKRRPAGGETKEVEASSASQDSPPKKARMADETQAATTEAVNEVSVNTGSSSTAGPQLPTLSAETAKAVTAKPGLLLDYSDSDSDTSDSQQ